MVGITQISSETRRASHQSLGVRAGSEHHWMRVGLKRFMMLGLVGSALMMTLGCETDLSIDPPAVFQPDPIVRTSSLIPEKDTTWQPIGRSILGKPIQAATIGDGPKRLYIVGGIHGNEPEGPLVAAALPAALNESPGLGEWTIRIVRDANPDGTAKNTRANTRGVDLNRTWPAKDFRAMPPHANKPLSELESVSLHTDIEAFKPDVVVMFQSSHLGPFANAVGKDPKLASVWANGARQVDPRWKAQPEYRYDKAGSLRSWMSAQKKTTMLTVELQRGRDSATNTEAIRAAIVAAFGSGAPAPVATTDEQSSKPAPATAADKSQQPKTQVAKADPAKAATTPPQAAKKPAPKREVSAAPVSGR